MPRKIRNEFDKKLTYENLMKAHNLSKRGKGYRKDIILFELKKEEYIQWLYEKLKNLTYKHGGYTTFYITEPKLRKIEKSRYIDRIVHRFVVDNFLEPYFISTLIAHTYACIKNRGMHKAALYIQNTMKHCKRIWGNYYILKMDIKKNRIYKHFKGDYYLVEDIATHSETKEKYVVYRGLYGNNELYIRPIEMFSSKVDKEKYPNVEQEHRFELQEIKSVKK